MQQKEMLRDIHQRSNLSDILYKLLPDYDKHNDSTIWDYTGTLTVKQYKRTVALYYQKQYVQIRQEFEEYIRPSHYVQRVQTQNTFPKITRNLVYPV